MEFAIVTNKGIPIRANVLELMLGETLKRLSDSPTKEEVEAAMIAAHDEIEQKFRDETPLLPPGYE
jgi:hypothetical protein